MEATKQEEAKKGFVDMCVEQAQRLFAKAEELGKDGHQFAIAGADLMASAARHEANFGPKQFSDLVVSMLPLVAVLFPKPQQPEQRPARELTAWEKREGAIEAHGIAATKAREEHDPSSATFHENKQRELIAQRDQEVKSLRNANFAGEVLRRFSDRVVGDLVDRLVELYDEDSGGSTKQQQEEILTRAAPVAAERIERLGRLIDIPRAAQAIVGVDID